jgi:hypothetical protein
MTRVTYFGNSEAMPPKTMPRLWSERGFVTKPLYICNISELISYRHESNNIIRKQMLNEDELLNDRKNIVSIRLGNSDRMTVRSMAARLFVRESKLYRFAIHHLINRLHKLNDDSCCGSELLLLFLDFKDELATHLDLKKHQLFKIFNGRTTQAEKFVAMSDIELLLMPDHIVRQRLQLIPDALKYKHADTIEWLRNYFTSKYALVSNNEIENDNEDNILSLKQSQL